ncbi:hypothetical protein VTN96DRAFT_3215 [Rasamsonia emersonii]
MSSGIISAGHHDTFRVMFWLLRSPFSQAVKEPVRECIATPPWGPPRRRHILTMENTPDLVGSYLELFASTVRTSL